MKKLLRHLRSVEQAVYPTAYQQLQDVQTWADLRDYCEGKPKVWTWKRGYCLVTKKELIDLASETPLSLADLRILMSQLAKHFGHREVSLDARASTSWRLIQFAVKRGWIKILSEEAHDWEGETFHEIVVRFL